MCALNFTGLDVSEFRGEEFIPLGHYDRVKRQAEEGSTGPGGPSRGGSTLGPPSSPAGAAPSAPSGPPSSEGIQPGGHPGNPAAGPPAGPPVSVPVDRGGPPPPPNEDNLGSGEDDPILVPAAGSQPGEPAGPPSQPGPPDGPPTGSQPSHPGWYAENDIAIVINKINRLNLCY